MEKNKTKRTAPIKKNVILEFNGNQVNTESLVNKAKKLFTKKHPDKQVKEIDLYINENEQKAYFVVNGEAEADYCFSI